eukprot:gene12789-26967_t
MLERKLFRSFMRFSKTFLLNKEACLLQEMPSKDEFNDWSFVSCNRFSDFVNNSFSPVVCGTINSKLFQIYSHNNIASIGGRDLKSVSRLAFQTLESNSSNIDESFNALRFLESQKILEENMSESKTDMIHIHALSLYDYEKSEKGNYWYYYRVSIGNTGTTPMQVLGRSWTFRLSDGSIEAEVPRYSPGVIGQTPMIPPGQAFQYMSRTVISQPIGTMEGSFLIRNPLDGGNTFEVKVPR